MKSLTGGELNLLNGKYGISSPEKSVPVMGLIRIHKPKSKEELINLIKDHQNGCECGMISRGTIEDFGKNLYETQIEEWGKYKFSLKECIDWQFNLFIVQSLKGNSMEHRGKELLQIRLPNHTIKETEGYLDEEIRVDLEVYYNKAVICGIQVKPISFNKTRPGIKSMNINRNKLAGFKVFYLYYDYDTEEFINLKEIVEDIIQLQYK